MRQLRLEKPDAEVDLCDACGGLWIDWFDGEVRTVATATLKASDSAQPSRPEAPSSRNEPAAVGACPRCTRQLVAERYAITAEVASRRVEGKVSLIPAATGAELMRCEECMGSFVSRASAEVLSWLSTTDEPPPSSAAVALKPVPWSRFVGMLRSFVGIKDR